MASNVQRTEMPAPYEGLDESVHPTALPATRAWEYLNWLLHYDDRVVMRGTVGLASDDVGDLLDIAGSAAGVNRYDGIMPGHGGTLAGTWVEDSDARQWPWWWREGGLSDQTKTPTRGRAWALNAGVGSSSDSGITAVSDVVSVSHAWAEYKGNTYGITTHAKTDAFTAGASRPSTVVGPGSQALPATFLYVVRPSGVDAADAITPFSAQEKSSAPMGGVDICEYVNRLWVAGGAQPLSSFTDVIALSNQTAFTSRVWFTNANEDPLAASTGVPATDIVTQANTWRPDATADFNFLQVGAETASDWIVKLIPLRNGILVLKRHSVWLITGTGLDTFSVRQISQTDGCVDPRGVAAINDVVYWCSESGVFRYADGDIVMMSQPISSRYQYQARGKLSDIAAATPYFRLHKLPNDYIMVQMGFEKLGTNGVSICDFEYWFHAPTGRWGQVEFYSATGGFNTVYAHPNGKYLAVDGEVVWDLTDVGDYATEQSARRGQDHMLSDHYKPIRTALRWRPQRGWLPHERALLHRVGIEYCWTNEDAFGSATGDAELRLAVRRYTRNNATASPGVEDNLAARVILASSSATGLPVWEDDNEFPLGNPSPFIKWFHELSETNDFYLELTRSGVEAALGDSPPPLVRHEVLGASVEWTPTHRRT